MTNIKRVRVTWAGSPVVGPAVSTFYFTSTASGFPADLKAFFTAISGQLASGLQINIPNSGDLVEVETGTLQGTWSDSGGGQVAVGVGTGFVNGVGARIKWLTGQVLNGRRVTGSTFIVPIRSDAFEGAGNITSTCITALQNAADALVSASLPDMLIWARPTPSRPVGNVGAVSAAQVPDLVSWLRSRRT